MTTTAKTPIGTFLDELASDQSTPGGGGAAALTASTAAALLSMVLHFTVGRPKYAEIEREMQGYLARTEALRRELIALVDADAAAFAAVTACYAMPKSSAAEKAARSQAMQEALQGAAQVPFAVATACLELIQLAAPVGAKGNANVVSDAATALYLAYGAQQSALVNVNVNLKYIKEPGFVASLTARRDELMAQTQLAYASACHTCAEILEFAL